MDKQRLELHRRIMVLRDQAEAGKVVIAQHLREKFLESLDRVRLADDRLIDVESVDGRVRAMASVVTHLHDRQEAKDEAPLLDIQHSYFERVEALFGGLYELMIERNATPHQMASWFVSYEPHVKENHETFLAFLEEIQDFWENLAYPAWAHTEDNRELKFIFGGEIFPQSNVASMYGFYSDTIVLPDPFVKIRPILSHWSKQRQVRETLRLALAVLEYKELALAGVNPPIVVILAGKHSVEEGHNKTFSYAAKESALKHFSEMFGEQYLTLEEVQSVVDRLQSTDAVERALKKPELLLFDTEWQESPAEQIAKFASGEGRMFATPVAGRVVYAHVMSRMNQVTDILMTARNIDGAPVIQAPTTWQWFNWMLAYSSGANLTASPSFHMVRALEAIHDSSFSWLGDIPNDALIEMRKSGAMTEIREKLSAGVTELTGADSADFQATGNIVVGNLRLAFAEHQERIRELRDSKIQFAKKSLGAFVVSGAIEIAAATLVHPMWGGAATIAQMTGVVPTVKELKEKYGAIQEKERQHRKSAVGLMFTKNEAKDTPLLFTALPHRTD